MHWLAFPLVFLLLGPMWLFGTPDLGTAEGGTGIPPNVSTLEGGTGIPPNVTTSEGGTGIPPNRL